MTRCPDRRTNPHDEWEFDVIHALMDQRDVDFAQANALFNSGVMPEPCPPEPLPARCYKQ